MVEEQRLDDGIALDQNMEARDAREMMKTRISVTLMTVQLMVDGVNGRAGVTATENVEEEFNTKHGLVLSQEMEARIVKETVKNTGRATPRPVNSMVRLQPLRPETCSDID